MFLKTRKVRHSTRFSSPLRASSRRRRETASTFYSTAAVQAILAGAFLMAGFRGYQAVAHHTSDLALPLRLAFPVLFTVAALLAARSALGNLRAGRETIHQHGRTPRQ